MLQDILNEFLNHGERYPEFDVDTMVLEHYQLRPGLYLRISQDNSIDELYVTKKSELSENDSLVEWFKQMDFFSALISVDKAIVCGKGGKKILSNNIFTLFSKYAILIGEDGINLQYYKYIDRHFNAFLSNNDKRSIEILTSAGYELLNEQVVQANKERLLASLEVVVKHINQYNIKDDDYIKLFLDVDKEAYAYESGRYMLPKIFNNNSYNISVDGKVLGLSNANMGMNAKKPYLEHKTAEFEVPYRITTEQAVFLHKLFLWLNGQTREGKPLYAGYIPVWEHSPGLFSVANEVGVRKPASYLHLNRGIGVTIDDYDFLPSFNDRMNRPIIFENYLDAPNYQGGKLDRLSAAEAHINKNLYAYQLVRNYDVERVKVTGKLSRGLADQIMLSRDAMRAWFRKGDILPIKSCIDKVTMGVLLARLQDMEYIPALAYALNVRFSLLKYFNEEGKDMGYAIENAYEELKDKVLDTKKTASCQSAMEFYLAVGQLLYYYFSLSQAQILHYDVLLRGITVAKDLEDIKKEYLKYFNKYAYAIDYNNPRYNNMLSVASSYTPEKEEPIDLDALLYGFASKNIIYYKNKEDS